jgi:hypothetical protein
MRLQSTPGSAAGADTAKAAHAQASRLFFIRPC